MAAGPRQSHHHPALRDHGTSLCLSSTQVIPNYVFDKNTQLLRKVLQMGSLYEWRDPRAGGKASPCKRWLCHVITADALFRLRSIGWTRSAIYTIK